jgi:hypothetical protein
MASSFVSDLTELTSPAANDFILVSDVSDPLNTDKKMQLAKLAIKGGTPTAGRLASWTDANILQDAGFLVSDFVRKSGTAPVAGRVTSWTDANSVQDSGIAVANVPQKSGTLVAGNNAHWSNTTGTLVDSGFAANDIARLSVAQTFSALKTFSGGVNLVAPTAILNVGDPSGIDTINASGATASITSNRYVATTLGPNFQLRKSRNATIGAHTIVANGDELGKLMFFGSDGSSFALGAQVIAKVDGTPGAGDMPTRIEFQTSADGTAAPTTGLTLAADNTLTVAGTLLASGVAAMIGGLHTAAISINNASFYQFTPPAVAGIIILWCSNSSQVYGLVNFRTLGYIQPIVLGANLTYLNGALNGTTGTAGKCAIGMAGSDLYIENQLGSARSFYWLILN